MLVLGSGTEHRLRRPQKRQPVIERISLKNLQAGQSIERLTKVLNG
jgi:hypothetical protein